MKLTTLTTLDGAGAFWEDMPGEGEVADEGGGESSGTEAEGSPPEGGSSEDDGVGVDDTPEPDEGAEGGAGASEEGGDEGADAGASDDTPPVGEWDGTAEGLEKVEGWSAVPENVRNTVLKAVEQAANDRAEVTRLLTGGHDDLQAAINEAVDALKADLIEKHAKELDDLRSGKVSAEDSYKSQIADLDGKVAKLTSDIAERDAQIAAYDEQFQEQYAGAITAFISEKAPGIDAAFTAGKTEAFDFFVNVLSNAEALNLPKYLPDAMDIALTITRSRFPEEAKAPRQPKDLPDAEALMSGAGIDADDTPPNETMSQRIRRMKREAVA